MHIHPVKTIQKLKLLRTQGYSISELMKKFSLPKTTVWHHIKTVRISPEYIKKWRSKQGGSKQRSDMEWQKARQEAQALLKQITKKDRILIAASLYWAEGAKKDFNLSNTDPKMVKTFISCLREMGIGAKQLTFGVRMYEDMDKDKVVTFWSNLLDVPKSEFKYINILKGKKNGKLAYGMCRVRLNRGGYFLKLMHSMREFISENID